MFLSSGTATLATASLLVTHMPRFSRANTGAASEMAQPTGMQGSAGNVQKVEMCAMKN